MQTLKASSARHQASWVGENTQFIAAGVAIGMRGQCVMHAGIEQLAGACAQHLANFLPTPLASCHPWFPSTV